MHIPKNPLVYEINTAVYLNRLSRQHGPTILLDTVPDSELDRLASLGVDVVWLMGIWQRSSRAIEIETNDTDFMAGLHDVLPDMTDEDLIGSAYSISDYRVSDSFGGEAALSNLRAKLQKRGIGLLLDFVPNHTALDHAWTVEHPDYYIHGNAEELTKLPDEFADCGGTIVAKGRDPGFPPWSDVAQLNAFSPSYRQAARQTLRSIASICDGVRCDMTMLMLSEVFARTWGERAGTAPDDDFWQSVIPPVREQYPDFMFLAEVYWNKEQHLIDQGFDYCYDKTLYDLLLDSSARKVRRHINKMQKYRNHLAFFIENHDEKRAASVFETARQKAAATIIATLPGLRLLHDGQLQGYKATIPVHLGRGPTETVDTEISDFYESLLSAVGSCTHESTYWRLIKTRKRHVVAYVWSQGDGPRMVIVNFSHKNLRAKIRLDPGTLGDDQKTLTDTVTETNFGSIKYRSNKILLTCKLKPWQGIILDEL